MSNAKAFGIIAGVAVLLAGATTTAVFLTRAAERERMLNDQAARAEATERELEAEARRIEEQRQFLDQQAANAARRSAELQRAEEEKLLTESARREALNQIEELRRSATRNAEREHARVDREYDATMAEIDRSTDFEIERIRQQYQQAFSQLNPSSGTGVIGDINRKNADRTRQTLTAKLEAHITVLNQQRASKKERALIEADEQHKEIDAELELTLSQIGETDMR